MEVMILFSIDIFEILNLHLRVTERPAFDGDVKMNSSNFVQEKSKKQARVCSVVCPRKENSSQTEQKDQET